MLLEEKCKRLELCLVTLLGSNDLKELKAMEKQLRGVPVNDPQLEATWQALNKYIEIKEEEARPVLEAAGKACFTDTQQANHEITRTCFNCGKEGSCVVDVSKKQPVCGLWFPA